MTSKSKHPGTIPVKHATETAGHLAVTSFPTAIESETVQAVRDRFSSKSFDTSDLLLVVDQDGRYRGAAELVQLLRAASTSLVSELVRPDWPQVAPNFDQEHAVQIAAEARSRRFRSLPRMGGRSASSPRSSCLTWWRASIARTCTASSAS